MKKIDDIKQSEFDEMHLNKEYEDALKNADFIKLVKKLKLDPEVGKKYISQLQKTVENLNNCQKCRALEECQNDITGYVFYPDVQGCLLKFSYVACKYQKKKVEEDKQKPLVFEEPLEIRNAKMADIDLSDKNRTHVIKWIKEFYNNYQKDQHLKGCFLHGSFGSGKSYLLAALINELAKKGARSVIIYYPELLRNLKESFADDFAIKMSKIKTADLLLIDDIGAESVSEWNRDEILGTILQYRMNEKLPTFFTSNLDIDGLKEHFANTKNRVDELKSERIIERISYLTDDLELISKDRRK